LLDTISDLVNDELVFQDLMMDYGLLEVFNVELVFLKQNVFDQKNLNALNFLGSKFAR